MKTPFGFAITAATAQWVESIWNWWVENWAIRSSACSLAQTANSFACSRLLASLTRSTRALHCAHLLAHSLAPELMGKRFLSIKRTRWLHTIPSHCAVIASQDGGIHSIGSFNPPVRPSFRPSFFPSVHLSVCPSIHPSALRFYHQKRYFLITEINGKWVIQTHTRARAHAATCLHAQVYIWNADVYDAINWNAYIIPWL